MAETSSNLTIQDIPEWKKPYYLALMNAATGLVMKPEYLQQQGVPMAAGYTPPQSSTYVPPGQPPPTDSPVDPNMQYSPSIPDTGGSSLARSAAAIEEMLRSNRIGYARGGVIRAAGGTRLSDAAKAIEDSLLAQGAAPTGSDVWLGPGGTPLGGVYNPVNVSPTPNIPVNIGTGTQPPPTPVPPSVTPPATAGPNGVISTPPSGTLTPGNPNPTPPTHVGNGMAPSSPPIGGQLVPGQSAPQAAIPMFLANRPGNFAGASQAANMGYNPAQYADDAVAQDLARNMGAQVAYTNTGGPIGPPSQAAIYSGGESFQNAGLVNDAYTRFKDDPGQLQLRLSQIRDEIRSLGGTPGYKKGGVVRAATGYFAGDSGSAGYSTQNPATVNPWFSAPAGEGTMQNSFAPAPQAAPADTPGFTAPVYSTPLETPPQIMPAQVTPAPMASPGTPAPASYSPPEPTPAFATGGFDSYSAQNPATVSPFFQQPAATPAAPAPYQGYSAQVPETVNQYFPPAPPSSPAPTPAPTPTPSWSPTPTPAPPASTNWPGGAAADPTPTPAPTPSPTPAPTNGMPASSIPSFDALQPYIPYGGPRTLTNGGEFGSVGPDGSPQISNLTRNALGGYSSIPSAFDAAGNIEAGRDAQGNATTNYGIANDTFNSAGQLALDASRRSGDASYNSPLTSSFQDTMNGIRSDPSRFMAGDIALGQLTASQLDAPLGVSPSQLTSYQMEGPRLLDMSKSKIDPTYIAGQNVGRITADPNSVRDVQGGQIGTGTFLDPGVAESYMSPYQKAVNDVRRRDAEKAYQEQNATRQAAAVRAGAFGGSRQAVADSLAEREMLNQKDRITAEGQQSAFENAQAQFERDRAAKMGADTFNVESRFKGDAANQNKDMGLGLANLQSWLQSQNLGATLGQGANIANQNAYMDAATKNQGTSLQAELANQAALQDANKTNLGAAIDVQELGANQSLTAQQANQAAGLRAGEANLNAAQQTQQLARMSGLDAAKSNQGTRLTQNQALLDAAAREDQLRQQADQGNFTNQLNAMGQETNSALAANTIGQSRADLQRLAQATEFQRLQQQMGAGATVDARTQSELDMAYQDFINQKNDPYQKLNWLSGLYSQQPQGYNQEQVLFNRTNPVSQIGGLATAGLGAVSSYLNKKKGGMVKMPKTVNMKKQKTGDWMAA